MRQWDKIVIGAGLYGLYAALQCARKGQRVVVLEKEPGAFGRATYINQARIHMGYHYPRSYSTAVKSAGYFERFVRDYGFCVVNEFEQIYATAATHSWSNRDRFVKFCADAAISCEETAPSRYFNPHMCDGAYITKEYAYDAFLLRDWFLAQIEKQTDIEIVYDARITAIKGGTVRLADGRKLSAPYILNATYAGTNEIHQLAGLSPFAIKYELCEVILCEVTAPFHDIGITVMDGPFFSMMPFGKTGYHSLTSVTFTPHATIYDALPTFDCQKRAKELCAPDALYNCNNCPQKPETAFPYMRNLARKFLLEKYGFSYVKSLFSMKPILKASEVDDSRPTVIRTQEIAGIKFVSVLSGKINTLYDLDEVL
jgi:glycine/D-amino acid oxidase-like deaminating enzyme